MVVNIKQKGGIMNILKWFETKKIVSLIKKGLIKKINRHYLKYNGNTGYLHTFDRVDDKYFAIEVIRTDGIVHWRVMKVKRKNSFVDFGFVVRAIDFERTECFL